MCDLATLCSQARDIRPKGISCEKDKLYHFFISYRQATELDMSQGLFTGIKATCVDKPFGASAEKPKIFLDVESLADGEQWGSGFVKGILHTTVAVPLVTWYGDNTGSAGQMVALCDSDRCDNVLLEWELTLALAKANTKMKSVFPVIHGGHDKRGYLDFPFDKLSMLPSTPSLATKARVVQICAKEGIPLSEEDVQRSVQDTVKAILAYQGVKLAELGSVIVANKQCTQRLFEKGASVLDELDGEEYGEQEEQDNYDADGEGDGANYEDNYYYEDNGGDDYDWDNDDYVEEETAPEEACDAPIDEEGHQTKWYTGANAYSCNVCDETFWEGGSRFRCGYCDYDMCYECAVNGA